VPCRHCEAKRLIAGPEGNKYQALYIGKYQSLVVQPTWPRSQAGPFFLRCCDPLAIALTAAASETTIQHLISHDRKREGPVQSGPFRFSAVRGP
jgi:hypothetical protein